MRSEDYKQFMLEFSAMMKVLDSKMYFVKKNRSKFRSNNILSSKEERMKHNEAIMDECMNQIVSRYEVLVAAQKEGAREVKEHKEEVELNQWR